MQTQKEKVIPSMFVQMSFLTDDKKALREIVSFFNEHKDISVDNLVVAPRIE